MDLEEIVSQYVDWIDLVPYTDELRALVKAVGNLWAHETQVLDQLRN
jgi:hypothetical protein